MWTTVAIIAVFVLYTLSIYNDLMAVRKQIQTVKNFIATEEQAPNKNAEKLKDVVAFYNNMVEKFNRQLERFPTSLLAKLLKISPETQI